MYRSDAQLDAAPPVHAAPVADPSPRASASWIEVSVGIAVMPITLTVMALAAPFIWIFSSRSAPKA